ncbi:GDSL-type esterase/lipase family protein [Bacteroidales bacterium OttesenSCG-928-J19]|nr:GDSL-type esterase/lipase family protein [Bacteroidales bacterium OttesenSCG-928-J19]
MSVTEHLAELERQMKIQQHNDSVNREFSDSMAFYTHFFETHPARFHIPGNDLGFFAELFDYLENEEGMFHILHYGDSQIEGDRITGFFRQKMQEKFGGTGVGLIPAVQIIETPNVSQTASENITRYTISGMHSNRAGHRRYGVLGQVAQVYGNGRISVSSRNWKNTFENVKEFSKIRLYVGMTKDFKVSISSSGANISTPIIENHNYLRIYSWEVDKPIKKFKLQTSGSAELYGISLDSHNGVTVDNIPFRGSSGTFYTTIDSACLKPMLKDLNVKLIMMQFGGNTLPYTKTDKAISNYKENMGKQIAYLQKIYPQAKIVLIGPSDMSTKVNGKLQTYPQMESFISGMREAAAKNGAAFWSLYDAMGGENSMISWVEGNPTMAAPDYVHFNIKGANRIAELFYESMMIYYDYYQFTKKHQDSLIE